MSGQQQYGDWRFRFIEYPESYSPERIELLSDCVIDFIGQFNHHPQLSELFFKNYPIIILHFWDSENGTSTHFRLAFLIFVHLETIQNLSIHSL